MSEREYWDSFTCPRCGRTSYNPNDVENQYCGACHIFWTAEYMEELRLQYLRNHKDARRIDPEATPGTLGRTVC